MGGYAEPLHVVVCDDDDVDAELIVEALERESVADSYTHVDSGPALLAYLRDPKTPRPCLILLDLSMPGMNGHDTLRAVRGDRSIRDIVVCVTRRQASYEMCARHTRSASKAISRNQAQHRTRRSGWCAASWRT